MATAASVDDLAQQARFTFIGSVVQLKATTMAQVPITDRTAIVEVDQIILAPETFRHWVGKKITVQLSDKSQVQEGQQYVFYTNGWLFGESIAVEAVDQRPVAQAALEMGTGGDPVQALADRDLQTHLADADLVIVGKVSSTRLPTVAPSAVGEGAPQVPVTRKDPHWREAVVEVEGVEKGSYTGQQVVVQYMASTDVAFYKAPKFKPGDEGVFLLHKVEEPPAGTAAAYSSFHEIDFQPRQKLDQIRTLIKASTS